MVAAIESIKLAALAATGHAELNWDEWNWYYSQITGQEAPAPEDKGWSRTSGGTVLIDGQPSYPVETWYSSAFGTVRGPGAGGGTGVGTSTCILGTLAQPSRALAGFLAGVLPENLKPQAAMIAAGALVAAGLLLANGLVRGVLIGAGAAGLYDAMQGGA